MESRFDSIILHVAVFIESCCSSDGWHILDVVQKNFSCKVEEKSYEGAILCPSYEELCQVLLLLPGNPFSGFDGEVYCLIIFRRMAASIGAQTRAFVWMVYVTALLDIVVPTAGVWGFFH